MRLIMKAEYGIRVKNERGIWDDRTLNACLLVSLSDCVSIQRLYNCFTLFCRQIRVNASSLDCAALGYAANCKSTSPSEEFFK